MGYDALLCNVRCAIRSVVCMRRPEPWCTLWRGGGAARHPPSPDAQVPAVRSGPPVLRRRHSAEDGPHAVVRLGLGRGAAGPGGLRVRLAHHVQDCSQFIKHANTEFLYENWFNLAPGCRWWRVSVMQQQRTIEAAHRNRDAASIYFAWSAKLAEFACRGISAATHALQRVLCLRLWV